MANYRPKGVERMSELGRRGGLASGEARRRATFINAIWLRAGERGVDVTAARLFAVLSNAGLLKRTRRTGGTHETDWRCPVCDHFSSIKRRACALCGNPGPFNGRLTRAALRARVAEHKTAAILRKFGLGR